MPTNYGDETTLEKDHDCLAKLHAAIVDSDSLHTTIAGNFNCCPGSRFFPEFTGFADDNSLVLSDYIRLNNVITYVSDDGTKTSWIDHILCRCTADTMRGNIDVIYNVVISDHKPMSFSESVDFYLLIHVAIVRQHVTAHISVCLCGTFVIIVRSSIMLIIWILNYYNRLDSYAIHGFEQQYLFSGN